MQRRNLLKTFAGIGTASALGFGGIAAFSQRGSAQLTTSFESNEVSLTNDTGDLSKLFISPSFRVEWDGFDAAVGKIHVLVEARARGKDGDAGEWSPVFRATPWINASTEGTATESAVSGRVDTRQDHTSTSGDSGHSGNSGDSDSPGHAGPDGSEDTPTSGFAVTGKTNAAAN